MARKRRGVQPELPLEGEDAEKNIISTGDISDNVGTAIGPEAKAVAAKAEGPGAKAVAVYINSLLNLTALFTLIKQHWFFLITSIALQAIPTVLWRRYADRFLLPTWVLLVGMGLLEASLLAGYRAKTQARLRPQFTLGMAVSLAALVGLVALESWRVFYPPRFPPEVFGVAVAQFGEGPEFRNTDKARDVSQAVLQQLTQQAQENSDLRFVQFRPIGLVRTAQETSEDGLRIGADLVIWGKLQVSEGKTILNFSILETPDKISNPRFPRVLPLFEPAATGFIKIDSQGSEEIAKSTTTISAFIFGLAHFFKWDFGAAARAFGEAPTATSPGEDDNYHYLLHLYYGLSLQWPGQLEKADEEFQKAIDLRPEDPAPRIARAFGYNSLGRVIEAQEEAKKALKLCSDRIQLEQSDYVAYFDRALANEILQDWVSALADYQAAKEKEPDLYIAYIGVVRMHLVLDQVPEAIQAAQEAIQLAEGREANPAWAYLYLAHAYVLNKDPSGARLAYEKATGLAPEVDWIHFQAGRFYAGTGEPQDLRAAEREYKAMIEVSSNPAWAHSTLADFYAAHDRPEEAITEYRAALQTNREAAGLWIALADVFAQLERKDDAREAYDRAIELEPGNFYAHFVYANFLFSQGELEAAIRHWETARQINPRHCGLLLNIGRAYELLGDREQAEALYRVALSSEVEPNRECQAEASRRLGGSTP